MNRRLAHLLDDLILDLSHPVGLTADLKGDVALSAADIAELLSLTERDVRKAKRRARHRENVREAARRAAAALARRRHAEEQHSCAVRLTKKLARRFPREVTPAALSEAEIDQEMSRVFDEMAARDGVTLQ